MKKSSYQVDQIFVYLTLLLQNLQKKHDYIGGFLVTAGGEIEDIAKFYEDKKDDYNSILIKSLGDRFAEGLAEKNYTKMLGLIIGGITPMKVLIILI